MAREHISAVEMALTGVMAGPAPDWMTSEHLTGVRQGFKIYALFGRYIDFYYGRGI